MHDVFLCPRVAPEYAGVPAYAYACVGTWMRECSRSVCATSQPTTQPTSQPINQPVTNQLKPLGGLLARLWTPQTVVVAFTTLRWSFVAAMLLLLAWNWCNTNNSKRRRAERKREVRGQCQWSVPVVSASNQHAGGVCIP